jgi:hypothetical protein
MFEIVVAVNSETVSVWTINYHGIDPRDLKKFRLLTSISRRKTKRTSSWGGTHGIVYPGCAGPSQPTEHVITSTPNHQGILSYDNLVSALDAVKDTSIDRIFIIGWRCRTRQAHLIAISFTSDWLDVVCDTFSRLDMSVWTHYGRRVLWKPHRTLCVCRHLKEVMCKVIGESQDDLYTTTSSTRPCTNQCGKCAEVQCPKAAMVTRRRKWPQPKLRVDQEVSWALHVVRMRRMVYQDARYRVFCGGCWSYRSISV